MYKLSSFVVLGALGLTACAVQPHNQPENLLFQKNSHVNSQSIKVTRDAQLCQGDTEKRQNCPVDFYIDNIKSGSFYINNSAQYSLKPETYNFKVKNCTDNCVSCDVKIDAVNLKNPNFIISVNEQGRPSLTNGDQTFACLVEEQAPVVKESILTVNLSADTLFKFDGATLNDLLPKGRSEVVDLANKITTGYASVSKIHLVGHTDRLGSEAYNQQLAQKRANTVRALLVSNGVQANVISTASAGKSQPVTQDCSSELTRAELQACLQPDRRVTVEITGIAK